MAITSSSKIGLDVIKAHIRITDESNVVHKKHQPSVCPVGTSII